MMPSSELESLMDQFLNRWTVTAVEKMKLDQYVNIRDKDTFCQWIETKTRPLGSVKGMTSIKFGIYRRREPKDKPNNYQSDDLYSWDGRHGGTRISVFNKIKKDILNIIRFSGRGEFDKIDDIKLLDFFKWKIAFLYSNERLIPVYKHEVLIRIANYFGLEANKNTPISQIQEVMIRNKPANLTVYEFMRELYDRFGEKGNKGSSYSGQVNKSGRTKRKPAVTRNTRAQLRTVNRSYFADQRHNKLQLALLKQLKSRHGKENVHLEKDFVDIKVELRNQVILYEVKSHSFASGCVREALGQILMYGSSDSDKRLKRYVVVGQYPANKMDKVYIDYVRNILKVNFKYMHVKSAD